MKLSEGKIGDSFKIISISADSQLKNRFYSFGIIKGAIAYIEEITLAKKTIEIKVQKSRIALRVSEAESIEIEKC